MATNILGIGIANAIGFRRYLRSKNSGGGSISYPGLIAAWSAKGKSNDDEDRATLKDLTGNGHDITLNGFAFSEMSGYGGYLTNFYVQKARVDLDVLGTQHWFVKSIIQEQNGLFLLQDAKTITYFNKTIRIRVSGLTGDNQLSVEIYGGGGALFLKNGINEWTAPDSASTFFVFNAKDKSIRNVEIEILPEYPDALVFDGVDDYGINEDMPLLDDYTIIVNRKLNTETNFIGYYPLEQATLANIIFGLEACGGTLYKIYSYGMGAINDISLLEKEDIVYQKKNSYNGKSIPSGTVNTDINQVFNLGGFRGTITKLYKGAFYSAYLFNRSLDEQEIKAFIRKYIDPEYLLPSEIPTPDCYYDFSQGSNDDENRETIKDYSGNGNNAVAHGFAWNEKGSGYKDGALVFDGVNDYISLDAFDSGFKTMFMVCNPLSISMMLYDQRTSTAINDFAIFNVNNSIAYNGRNINGTYINNILNTKVTANSLIGKKQLIAIKSKLTELKVPIIGANYAKDNFFANMAIYKFLGFKEALTEEQIQYVIKKYNLLDGVDEIEVS